MKLIGKLIFAGALSLSAATLRADAIWIGESNKNPIMAGGIRVLRVDANSLTYSTSGGTEATKPLEQIQQINADGEPDFNVAEQAYREGKWTPSANSYQKAIRTTATEWVRDRSSLRLAEVATKISRFDVAATAYVGLLMKDATLAAKAKPALSDAAASYYDSAISDIKRPLDTGKLSDPQRALLLGFLLEIQRAKRDTVAANQTVSEMIKLGVASPDDVAMVRIGTARAAMDGKDYVKATSEIEQNRKLFNDPAQQTEALFILARSRDATAGSGDDPEALKNLAIAYMRVVAAGKDVVAQPHVAEALLRIAQIEEKLKEPAAAMQLYQQITRDFSERQIVAQAKAALDRLAPKGT